MKVYMQNLESTPIHKLDEKLNENAFYIKREDLIPISFGGNKCRKALLFFADIENKNADCIVTYGSSSSNHCRIISNMAAAKGLPCYIISPIEASKVTNNSKMMQLFSKMVTQCPIEKVAVTIDEKIAELKAEGYHPYFIEGGGHGNIGTQAYVNAYKEILNYESANGLFFDYIFHASGTGTTQAGLVCGKIIYGDDRQIIGISIARKNPYGAQIVIDSVNEYLAGTGNGQIAAKEVAFVDDFIMNGYGDYDDDILQTIRTALLMEGIPLDTTYTGKAYWGMKQYIKKNKIMNKNILFIHTGGMPLFFDDLEKIL